MRSRTLAGRCRREGQDRSIPVRCASGGIVDVTIRPGYADTAAEFAELVEMLRESLPAGSEIIDEECAL